MLSHDLVVWRMDFASILFRCAISVLNCASLAVLIPLALMADVLYATIYRPAIISPLLAARPSAHSSGVTVVVLSFSFLQEAKRIKPASMGHKGFLRCMVNLVVPYQRSNHAFWLPFFQY